MIVAMMVVFALLPLTGALVAYAAKIGMEDSAGDLFTLAYFAAIFTVSTVSQAVWVFVGVLVLLGVPP